ncbi:PQQ-binding-like beta-propeller repeat protein [Haloarcula amylovorans]|uniref:PQQ-binding-like beta-propeller repeat protein n=1 Tax=Haloarcula amylovorans TaxID=2562280 RepID=UPI0010761100|nr:PQQ-binding-like beta-propeller repeat protein [Halomicroarcula amylolytica]
MSNQTPDSSTSRRTLLKALGGATALAGVGSVGGVLAQQSDSGNDDGSSSNDSLSGWTSTYGGPGNTNYAPTASEPKEGVSLRWIADPEPETDSDYSISVVHNGTAYVSGQKFHALDTESGDVRWTFSTENSQAFEQATGDTTNRTYFNGSATDGETVYVGSGTSKEIPGAVYAIDPESGTKKWRFQRDPSESEAPEYAQEEQLSYSGITTSEDRVFVVVDTQLPNDSLLVALDAETGEKLWSEEVASDSPTYGGGIQAASVADGKVFPHRGGLQALDAETGEVVWSFDGQPSAWKTGTQVPVADGTVYTTGETDETSGISLFALNIEDGSVEWKYEPDTAASLKWSAPVVDDESVYINYRASADPIEPTNETVAVSREDGTLQYEGANLGNVADGVVYTEEAAYDTADGSKLFEYGFDGQASSPVLYGNGLFFGGPRVFVLEPGQGEATVPGLPAKSTGDPEDDFPEEPVDEGGDSPDEPSETPNEDDDPDACED